MKIVSTYLEIDFKDEVLESLPRTTRIDGIEVLKRVRASLGLKIRKTAERKSRELLENNPDAISIEHAVEYVNKTALTYDNVIAMLIFLLQQGKVAATYAGPLPVFQRID
jgi:hypothetical protein